MTEVEFEKEMLLEKQINCVRISRVARVWGIIIIYLRLKALPSRVYAKLMSVGSGSLRRVNSHVLSPIKSLLRHFKR
jgi:hypothetical protein